MDPLEGEVLVATVAGRPVGLVGMLTEHAERLPRMAEVRVLVVEPDARRRGIASALLDLAEGRLRAAGVTRAWLVTTNDNLDALGFYQRRDWRIVEVRSGAIEELRRTLKPSIPEIGEHRIPLRDELELAKDL